MATDNLARAVTDLIADLHDGTKSVAIKTGLGGGKLLTIVDTPKTTVKKELTG
jgi:hypothetical protein